MEKYRPQIENKDTQQDLSKLVEVIKKYWEGKDYCFIKQTNDNTLEFFLTVSPNNKETAELAVAEIKALGFEVKINPNQFTDKLPGKIEFTGNFSSEDIGNYAEELGIILAN